MNIAVLVKQVPKAEGLTLGRDGRLDRSGAELEMNAYCRRAVSKGVELVADHGGHCAVFTLGPPAAEDVLREAVAWGADEGVLISDRAFAGSDTLATARALAAALAQGPRWDLVLVGRNSIDADTGQVGPQLAQLLDLPFAAGVRQLVVVEGAVEVTCELDDGWRTATVTLPAVLSAAERLTDPCKVPAEGRAAVSPDRVRRLDAATLGPGPWGEAASRTRVGDVRTLEADRRAVVLSGAEAAQVDEAVRLLEEWGALGGRPSGGSSEPVGDLVPERRPGPAEAEVLVVMEPDRPRLTRELLGEAARLAAEGHGAVTALGSGPLDAPELATWGADRVIELEDVEVEEDVASAAASWCREHPPWAGLLPGTLWGREVASRLSVLLDAGLTGDAVGFGRQDDRLVAWKPAFGGRLVAGIHVLSDVQLATVRPGILALRAPRPGAAHPHIGRSAGAARGRVQVTGAGRDDEVEALLTARRVVALGSGVDPAHYPLLDPLLRCLGAELAASRKVTDQGWLPRARQVGITGHTIDPALLIAVGISGKFNHMVGVRNAGTILAVNCDPNAPVFDWVDVGIVGDWHEVVPLLAGSLAAALLRG